MGSRSFHNQEIRVMEEAYDFRIVVNALATDLEKIATSNYQGRSPQKSICRIPNIGSTGHDPKVYTPDAFSIGPFHFGKPHLKETQKIKLRYLHCIISRLQRKGQEGLEYLTNAIIDVQKEALEYYDGQIGVVPDEFVKILVLDGCFIVELFRRYAYKDLIEENDPMFKVPRMRQYLWHDLILLENQIPWMVLDILFHLTRTSIDKKCLIELAIEFFGNIFSSEPTPFEPLLSHPCKHILDLLRNSLVFNYINFTKYESHFRWEEEHMRSATILEESGIKFKKATSSSILDIRFNNGELKVPELLVHEHTDVLFRNLITLELYCPDYDGVVTSYVLLLANLIRTNTDMKILCNAKAINNSLDLEDATEIFNYPNIAYSYVRENIYGHLTHEVNRYCQRSWKSWRHLRYHYGHRWPEYKKVLKAAYFGHPWAVISTIAACILLILTFLQTLFTILYK